MPRTEPVASRGNEHDLTVLAVGAVVLVGVLLMGAWVAVADAAGSHQPPKATVVYRGNGPDGSPTTTTTLPPPPALAPASNEATLGQTASVGVAGASDAPGGVSQTIGVSVLPGALTVSPASASIAFTRHGKGHGVGGPHRGDLPPVTIVDARGSLVGWNATVSLQGIDGLSASQLASAELCVTPAKPAIVAGNPGEVRQGAASCGGPGAPLSVFFAPPGGGGGTFTDTAGLTLVVPGRPAAS